MSGGSEIRGFSSKDHPARTDDEPGKMSDASIIDISRVPNHYQ